MGNSGWLVSSRSFLLMLGTEKEKPWTLVLLPTVRFHRYLGVDGLHSHANGPPLVSHLRSRRPTWFNRS